MNKKEVGRYIAVNVGEDISQASNYEIIVSIAKYTLTVGPGEGVTRPAVDLTFTPEGATEPVTYNANEYLRYTTQSEDDIPVGGEWSGRSHIEFISPSIANFYGDIDTFFVGE